MFWLVFNVPHAVSLYCMWCVRAGIKLRSHVCCWVKERVWICSITPCVRPCTSLWIKALQMLWECWRSTQPTSTCRLNILRTHTSAVHALVRSVNLCLWRTYWSYWSVQIIIKLINCFDTRCTIEFLSFDDFAIINPQMWQTSVIIKV